MSIWTRIAQAIAALRQGESLSAVFDLLRAPPERSVAFAIAVIALGAKMAKADGQVTRNEVAAFREVFTIPPEEEKNAARVFNMARTDVAGFEDYARRIARMFRNERGPLCDLMEGLFHIALADGDYHPDENAFLQEVARIFEIDERSFARLRARFVPDAEPDPYDVLGVEPDDDLGTIRGAWRAVVRETHPDRLAARGLPEEAMQMAEKRLIAANRAWERINELRDAAETVAMPGPGGNGAGDRA
ncbi:molecular chaperone DjiA [Limimaricola pyoseonensis]|uniref:DnaJ like chaperone protein n=1 Tax=Limimaricola pyoseonensis TaxID=521013 RepID=A0A1G7D080_9RHOB|nr:molecular chaperone DjiA [Limimaricola pyoseonensis]SDE44919.1 DnaJ like chaperone protein [Limimaricola pyoseonensis]